MLALVVLGLRYDEGCWGRLRSSVGRHAGAPADRWFSAGCGAGQLAGWRRVALVGRVARAARRSVVRNERGCIETRAGLGVQGVAAAGGDQPLLTGPGAPVVDPWCEDPVGPAGHVGLESMVGSTTWREVARTSHPALRMRDHVVQVADLGGAGAAGEDAGQVAEQDLAGLAFGDLIRPDRLVPGDVEDLPDQDRAGCLAPFADLLGGDRAVGVLQAADRSGRVVAFDGGLGEVDGEVHGPAARVCGFRSGVS